MSKYNNAKSIAIEELSEQELSQAIREWAEGDDAMERLLWSCYRNGVKTSGCHVGCNSYIGIEYEEKNNKKVVQLIGAVLNAKGSNVLLSPDGGNPFSGSSWYKPDIVMGFESDNKDEVDQLFDMMSDTLNISKTQYVDYSSIVRLFEFLIGKYSGLSLRISHTQNNEFVFMIGKSIHEEEIRSFDELNDLLTAAGLKYDDNDTPHKDWIYKSKQQKKFIENLNSISDRICNNYSLKKPKSIEDTRSFNIKAHIKRDECIRNGNLKEFDLWLKKERKKIRVKVDNEKEEDDSYWLSIGMCLGISIGTSIGVSTNNMGLWIPIGICIGLCLGLAFSNSKKHNNKK